MILPKDSCSNLLFRRYLAQLVHLIGMFLSDEVFIASVNMSQFCSTDRLLGSESRYNLANCFKSLDNCS